MFTFNYKEQSDDFNAFLKRGLPSEKQTINTAKTWLMGFDESLLGEGERLNTILCVIKWCTEHDCLDGWLSDELYLYYEDFVNGKLDDVIDPEERDDVVRDLTAAFNKAFPNGLEE